jgi:hypothetical protein
MTRLLLLCVLCVCTWIYFPESRAILVETTEPLAERVMGPFTSWGALDEMRRVGRNVVAHERLTGDVPEEGSAWGDWLDERYRSQDIGRDAWGATYRLVVWPDSVGIVSYGPDGLPHTNDDLQIAMPRG